LRQGAAAAGVDVRGVRVVAGAVSAQYLAFLQPDGELCVAAAAMEVLEAITPDDVRRAWPDRDAWVFAEANLTSAALAGAIASALTTGVRLAVDAVSVPKATRLPAALGGIAVLFGNLDEARALVGSAEATPEQAAALLRGRGAGAVVVTLGQEGAVVLAPDGETAHVPGVTVEVHDVTGAGDTLIATTLAASLQGCGLVGAVRAGIVAAAESIGR
jgi:pseudouridine kinase